MFEKMMAERHLRHLDLDVVREKMMDKYSMTAREAVTGEIEYKRFLYAMIKKDKGEMLSPPTQAVDDFWHQHILFTEKYTDDCDVLFGHYLHHSPALPEGVQKQADKRRQEVYDEFDVADMFSDLLHAQLEAIDGTGADCDGASGDSNCDGGGGSSDGGGSGCGGGGCGGD